MIIQLIAVTNLTHQKSLTDNQRWATKNYFEYILIYFEYVKISNLSYKIQKDMLYKLILLLLSQFVTWRGLRLACCWIATGFVLWILALILHKTQIKSMVKTVRNILHISHTVLLMINSSTNSRNCLKFVSEVETCWTPSLCRYEKLILRSLKLKYS